MQTGFAVCMGQANGNLLPRRIGEHLGEQGCGQRYVVAVVGGRWLALALGHPQVVYQTHLVTTRHRLDFMRAVGVERGVLYLVRTICTAKIDGSRLPVMT